MVLETAEFAIQGLRLDEPPTVEQAAMYWFGILVLQVLLVTVVWALRRRFRLPSRKLAIPGLDALRSMTPAVILARQLSRNPAEYLRPMREPEVLDDLAGARYLYGLMAIDSIFEELVFRGVPLLAAITLGFEPFAAVALGTFIWVIAHDVDTVPNTLLAGVFYGWLWLSGAWYLAIAFHVFTNWFGHTVVRAIWWSDVGRYPA